MVNAPHVVVTTESDQQELIDAAREMALRLQTSFIPNARAASLSKDDLILAYRDDGLELRDIECKPGRGLRVDFTSLNPSAAARRGHLSRSQPLAKAIGKSTRTVLDATAGLGHDAALLACMGYRVLAVERSPIAFALLQDGLRRARAAPELQEFLDRRLAIVNADAGSLIEQMASHAMFDELGRESSWAEGNLEAWTFPPEAAYIDPMFPPKRKSTALAKKSIRLVRKAVGDDPDAADLVAIARRHIKRVIVKRPTYASPLADDPTMSFGGKLVRYDVYVAGPHQTQQSRA